MSSSGWYYAYWVKSYTGLPVYWDFDSEFVYIRWRSDCCYWSTGFKADIVRYG